EAQEVRARSRPSCETFGGSDVFANLPLSPLIAPAGSHRRSSGSTGMAAPLSVQSSNWSRRAIPDILTIVEHSRRAIPRPRDLRLCSTAGSEALSSGNRRAGARVQRGFVAPTTRYEQPVFVPQ